MFSGLGWSDADYGDDSFSDYLKEAAQDLEMERGGWSNDPTSEEIRDRAAYLATRGGCSNYQEYSETVSELTVEGAWGSVTWPTLAEVKAHVRPQPIEVQEPIVVPVVKVEEPKVIPVVKVEEKKKSEVDSMNKIIDLALTKKHVIEKISEYISPWKLTLFGHHYDKEASALINSIKRAKSIEDIKDIVEHEQFGVNKGGYFKILEEAQQMLEKPRVRR